jgi:hypothetical protein
MSDLEDVLELMRTSTGRWASLRIDGFEWRHLKTFHLAWEHHVTELRKRRSVTVMSAVRSERVEGGEPPEESLERWRVWLAKPDKRRVQFQVGDEVVAAVFLGDWWWSWSPSRGFMTNGGAPNHSHGFGPAEGLIDHSGQIASLDLRVNGRSTFLSRPVFRVTVVPRLDEHGVFDRTLHMLGTGADEYRLVVDREIGVLLRCEARYGGNAFRVIEADEVGVDEVFSQGTFEPELLRAGLPDASQQ